jgi:hypothetical protein
LGEEVAVVEPRSEPSSQNLTEEMEAGITAVEEAEILTVEVTMARFAGAVITTDGVLVWVYTYAPISHPAPKLYWLSVMIFDGHVEAGSSPS